MIGSTGQIFASLLAFCTVIRTRIRTGTRTGILTAACVVSLTAVILPSAIAAVPDETRKEVNALLDVLEQSGCKFQRNGSWHSGAEARRHLQTKIDYLVKRDLLQTTQHFIDRAASKSSVSGQAYQVLCSGKPAVVAAVWWNEQLDLLRKHKRG